MKYDWTLTAGFSIAFAMLTLTGNGSGNDVDTDAWLTGWAVMTGLN